METLKTIGVLVVLLVVGYLGYKAVTNPPVTPPNETPTSQSPTVADATRTPTGHGKPKCGPVRKDLVPGQFADRSTCQQWRPSPDGLADGQAEFLVPGGGGSDIQQR